MKRDLTRWAGLLATSAIVFAACSSGGGAATTAPSTAMTVLQAAKEGVENFSVFCNHIMIIPALKAMLDSWKSWL